ncbi:unnamed protein product [Dibothriocephalus latus]|uniref:Uncharacterized protein n=1 Tax=Dibothriocephalus latus TaxID=60516 RepID=A0A3P6QV56_DIBLA|nr:unnamed protein product [Dibothriocephalus latus]
MGRRRMRRAVRQRRMQVTWTPVSLDPWLPAGIQSVKRAPSSPSVHMRCTLPARRSTPVS